MLIYKQYDQASLDNQYNNRLHVPGFAKHFERWELLSRETEKALLVVKDLQYGLLSREQLDIYPSSEPSSKTLIFIHGGYWHKPGKEDVQFIARAFRPYGITTVLINYPLAPAVSIDQISASCCNAIHWLYQNVAAYNGNPDKLFVTGYSAGGHLAAMLQTIDWKQHNLKTDIIKGVCTISGIFNLIPIQLSDLNNMLNMDNETAIRNSPVQRLPSTQCPLAIAVGSNETDEFLAQSRELYACWKESIPIEKTELRGINHYSILETMIDPASILHQMMLRLMEI